MKKLIICSACIIAASVLQAAPLTSSIQEEIKKRAVSKWPDDYSMQAYEIKSQTQSFEQFQSLEKPSNMSNSTFQLIKDRATKKWPGDYSMQLYELKNQISGWIEVNGK